MVLGSVLLMFNLNIFVLFFLKRDSMYENIKKIFYYFVKGNLYNNNIYHIII